MSDATDKEAALVQLEEMVQIEVEPTLTLPELESILDRHKRASRWVTATALVYGDVIMPTVRNGHRYMVTDDGGTTTTEPDWPLDMDGAVGALPEFTEVGIDYDNVYDIRAAAKEAWQMKLAKAAEMVNNPVSGNEAQIFFNCEKMAARLGKPILA